MRFQDKEFTKKKGSITSSWWTAVCHHTERQENINKSWDIDEENLVNNAEEFSIGFKIFN